MLLHRQFIASARRVSGRLAFIDRTTATRMSYRQALCGTLLLARRFRRYPDAHLGIMLPNSAACALSILATLMAGKVPVMINYSTGAERNARYAQTKCGFRTIVTSRTLLEKVHCEPLADMVFIEDNVRTFTGAERLLTWTRSKLPLPWLLRGVGSSNVDDTMLVLFTSGSEREPKAVQLSHRNIGSNLRAIGQVFDIHDSDVFLAVLPWFHVFGQTAGLWLPLIFGLTLVTHGNPLEFKTVSRIIREERPTVMLATPYFLMGYLRQSAAGDFASLRVVVAGADKMPAWLSQAYQEKHGIRIYEGYGATETSPVISVNLPDAHKPGSVGRPLPGVDVRIVDVDNGAPLLPGQEGKILVKGELVMKGYLGDAAETASRITDGWYETGDRGVLDSDGYLWHRGRTKRFVKIGGEMVSLAHVENELERVLPAGVECCAVALPDDKRGSRIAVALTREINEPETLQKLAEHLPAVALPQRFLVVDELPKMASGKIDFRRAEELIREQSRL
ncbi:MAG: AMP-binding protein [Acidiferrobacterales bacterium]|nr:AMP-binding protein [Acidiferrobacterales bacterium]